MTPTHPTADPAARSVLDDCQTITGPAAGGPPDPGSGGVPGYEIVRELGRGGMGAVYLAKQAGLNRPVALKLVLGGGAADPKPLIRFLAEAEAVAAVRHPNVVEVYQYGEHAGRPFLAMEFCPGGSLADRLKDGHPDPRVAAELLAGVAAGVAAAHAAGIVHRDLKPHNVLLAAAGRPKVTDFGLAKRAAGDSALTRTNAVMGTPAYMAPEQAQGGAKFVGPAADVWALGVMLYELLTGTRPFAGDDTFSLLAAVMRGEVEPPRRRVPGVPRDLELICLKCLEMDPAKRYPTAAELAADLGRYLDGRPILARPLSAREQAWRWVKRHPAAGATAGVVLAAVGTVVGVLASSNASLKLERDAAEAARREADGERVRAAVRLDKAVEAVEKMVARVGTGRWARNPALAGERRAVLEDVAAYYEGFGEAGDPVVRRETARAYRRIGGAYLLLAEYHKADDYLGRAVALCDGLAADFPDDPRYAADLAEARLFAGHAAASNGRAAEAGAAYGGAAEAARRAVAGRPADDDARRTLVACLLGHGFFRMQVDRASAAPLFGEAVRLADDLLGRPAVPFGTRALAAYSYAGAATFDFIAGRVADGQAKLDQAAAILARAAPDPDTPAHYLDLADLTTGVLKMSAASVLAGGRKLPDAATLLREAAETFDRLLAVSPKAFQYLIYKLMILSQEVAVLERLKRTDEAGRRRAELLATEDALLRSAPDATYVRRLTVTQRSAALARRVQDGDLRRLDAEAAGLLETARDLGAAGDGVRYNVACVYSLASRHGTPAEREARATGAVKLLAGLLDGNFYHGPTNAAHVDKDADLDPVRERGDFKAFRTKLAALPPVKAP